MPLTRNEIESLIVKLRDRYSEYGDKHSAIWFNRDAFEERLAMAVKNRMNMEGFILAEISNFEKTREKYDKKKKQKNFSDQVDRIIEENMQRVRKYPAIEFHPRAGVEMTHFYGALNLIVMDMLPVLRLILTDPLHRRTLEALESRYEFLAMPRGKLPARRVEDHLLMLNRRDVREIEIEADRNDYLKEGAFALHELVDFCDGLMECRSADWEQPLRMDKLFLEEQRRRRIVDLFSGTTAYGVILKIRDTASAVIEDFRLRSIRKV